MGSIYSALAGQGFLADHASGSSLRVFCEDICTAPLCGIIAQPPQEVNPRPPPCFRAWPSPPIIYALTTKRAELDGELMQVEKRVIHLREELNAIGRA